jgi:hypothetical protein
LGALAHPDKNTTPAMDRLKPNAARIKRKEIWEYNMLEFLTIFQLSAPAGRRTRVIPCSRKFLGSAAPANGRKKPTVLPRWVFLFFKISNCVTTAWI